DPISNHRPGASQAATLLPRAAHVFGVAGKSSESNTLIPPATCTSPRPLRLSTVPGSDMQSFSLRIDEHRINDLDLYGLIVERVQRPQGRPRSCGVSKQQTERDRMTQRGAMNGAGNMAETPGGI